jgi:Tol biopolymer transport system component
VEPALSPDGSSVAFASDRSGSFEIYVVSLARGSKEIPITSDGKNNVQPAWSPDGRWIAYAHNNGGGLWIVPSTGGTPRQLVESGANPVWSPDSNWIAFTTQTGMVGQSSLRVVGRDGSGLRDLTHLGAPVGGHRSPAWSNGGRFIAFVTVRGADESSVWIVDVAGGTPRRLQTALGYNNLQFSRDDHALYFTETANTLYRLAIDPNQGTATGQPPEVVLSLPGEFDGISMARNGLLAYGLAINDTNLWTVDLLPGGEARDAARLTDEAAARTTRPNYSPDGRRLTYGQSGGNVGPWVMNADGSGKSPLITEGGGAGNESWAPDGTRVLVQRNGARSLWWIDLATHRLTPLALDFARSDRNPRLSPNGREIAYWKIEADGSTNTWTQALDGGSPRRVTADAESINYPAWSPDGRWLAVTIKRGKLTHVGVVSKNGGPVEQITHATGLSGAHSWSPDGDQIAFAGQRDGVWNVWAVSRRTGVSRQLTHFTAPSDYVLYPSWSPDGHRIAFERGIRRGSVWTVQVP